MCAAPNALTEVLADLQETELRTRFLLSTPNQTSLRWRLNDRGWSILQCIQHLAATNLLLANALEPTLKALPAPESEHLHPGPLWRLLLAMVEPECRLKGFAPNVLQPHMVLDPDVTLADYHHSHLRLRAVAERCGGLDLNHPCVRHPVLRLRMSAGVVFLLAAGHERRHLFQAERLGGAYTLSTDSGNSSILNPHEPCRQP